MTQCGWGQRQRQPHCRPFFNQYKKKTETHYPQINPGGKTKGTQSIAISGINSGTGNVYGSCRRLFGNSVFIALAVVFFAIYMRSPLASYMIYIYIGWGCGNSLWLVLIRYSKLSLLSSFILLQKQVNDCGDCNGYLMGSLML